MPVIYEDSDELIKSLSKHIDRQTANNSSYKHYCLSINHKKVLLQDAFFFLSTYLD